MLELSSSAITEANAAVSRTQQAKAKETKKQGAYLKINKTKIKIGKYSSEKTLDTRLQAPPTTSWRIRASVKFLS